MELPHVFSQKDMNAFPSQSELLLARATEVSTVSIGHMIEYDQTTRGNC